MSAASFEALYRADPDPWRYTSSPYEREKYGATLSACGPGQFENALELGASIGVFSLQLAALCDSLTTIDAAPTAVAAARKRLRGVSNVEVILGTIPDDVPRARYDLVVASEVLYYLSAPQLGQTLSALDKMLVPRGRLVAVHWRPPGPERPFTAAQVHASLRSQQRLIARRSAHTADYLLDVLERR